MDPFGWLGHTIDGKYRIDSVVGEGGFAVVYRGHHLAFNEAIAVKCLKLAPSLGERERAAFLAKFLDEGRLLHKLSKATAGIVQALDAGATRSPSGAWTPYLVLEWLEGTSLHDAMNETTRPVADAIALLAPAARALAVAHEHGVAHRDIKPANLFLANVGGAATLKILDFGIAKVLQETTETSAATLSGSAGSAMPAFTPRYAAPEQFARAYGPTGPWTDVFAFALVFVEVVTGLVALEGDEAPLIYLRSCDLARRPTLRTLGMSNAPARLEAVLTKALAVDPRRRYASLGEFWDAVEGAVPDVAGPTERARRTARLKSDLSIALPERRARPSQASPNTSSHVSGSLDVRHALAPRSRLTSLAFAVGASLGVAGAAVYLTTANADEQLARAAAMAAAGLATSPSPTEPPPLAVKTFAFKVPMEAPHELLRISPCGKVGAFNVDAVDVSDADLATCLSAGDCDADADATSRASDYCRFVGQRALTGDEQAVLLRALDASAVGLRCVETE